MDKITKPQYLKNPCGTLATAFWKQAAFPVPAHIQLIHENDAAPVAGAAEGKANVERYFRLVHYPQANYDTDLPEGYIYTDIDISNELPLVADMINRCYPKCDFETEDILRWTKYPVFDNNLWLFVRDTKTGLPVASGLADFDADICEGSLEWIQVSPEFQGKGFGKKIVSELLCRLSEKAKFVTVSGEVDNPTNPEALYRKCGFTGNDIWRVIREEN